jgi:hypothetical protein
MIQWDTPVRMDDLSKKSNFVLVINIDYVQLSKFFAVMEPEISSQWRQSSEIDVLSDS